MKLCALASGSSGNCFYVGDNDKAVLVDVGISAKQVLLRMQERALSIDSVKGILVTHEHSDHIRGVDVLARQFNIPIYITKKTAKDRFICSEDKLINEIANDETIDLAGMEIESFTKSHKAADPVFFSISKGRKRASIITDAGVPCKNIREQIEIADFLFLESNHDLMMLNNGPYPYYLKKWVGGDDGHLSNVQAGLAVLEHARPKLKNVVLSHLSKTNNTPKVALNTFNSILKERSNFSAKVSVSEREQASEIFKI